MTRSLVIGDVAKLVTGHFSRFNYKDCRWIVGSPNYADYTVTVCYSWWNLPGGGSWGFVLLPEKSLVCSWFRRAVTDVLSGFLFISRADFAVTIPKFSSPTPTN
ncbi:dTDP-4-dehydrorhamnose reductase [Arthrospira platensis C1]|nr:dTDP-4-dehydrorhamnose reductase [Arthrospira platensis C1]